MPRHELPLPLGRRFYRRPCAACSASSALLKVSVPAFLRFSTTSWGASLLWAVEATSSLLAGKFIFGRYCWSWPRSRLPRLPKLMRYLLHRLTSCRDLSYPPGSTPNVADRQARASSKVSAGLVGVASSSSCWGSAASRGLGLNSQPFLFLPLFTQPCRRGLLRS